MGYHWSTVQYYDSFRRICGGLCLGPACGRGRGHRWNRRVTVRSRAVLAGGRVTQLGDGHALARHRALRERLDQHTSELSVEVNEDSAGEHRMLYGPVAWDASFADAGAALEEIAHRHGGAAYQ